MQQPPNPYPQQQPPMPPPKKKSRKGLFIILGVILAVALVGCVSVAALVNAGGSGTGGSTSTPTPTETTAAISNVIPTVAPTAKPTPIPTLKPTLRPQPTQPTVAPTQAATAGIPSASEFSQLFSAKDGSVTNVNINKLPDGSTGVALDVQVNNPTQTSVKHINYILMQFLFGARSDVGLVNIDYHANGYTGADDPIASCAGVKAEYSLGYDENQLWDKMQGFFNANLPA